MKADDVAAWLILAGGIAVILAALGALETIARSTP